LEVPAEATISVGDQVDRDVEPARAAGIHGVLLDRFDDHPEFTPRITELTELLGWLTDAAPRDQ
jgi:FMN phosphatase YigB (HAD superfamily)